MGTITTYLQEHDPSHGSNAQDDTRNGRRDKSLRHLFISPRFGLTDFNPLQATKKLCDSRQSLFNFQTDFFFSKKTHKKKKQRKNLFINLPIQTASPMVIRLYVQLLRGRDPHMPHTTEYRRPLFQSRITLSRCLMLIKTDVWRRNDSMQSVHMMHSVFGVLPIKMGSLMTRKSRLRQGTLTIRHYHLSNRRKN